MSSSSKRKRNTRDMRCVLFPEDVKDNFTRKNRDPSKATKSWARCGESFWDTAVIKKLQSTRRTRRTVQFLRESSTSDTDYLPTIDSESEHEDEDSILKKQVSVVLAEISDYSTSDDEGGPEENRRLDVSVPDPPKMSASEWIRSAQALLQTPQKQMDRTLKTPEDSGKKKRKFECGGLAERLNRLQGRQRSAVSFWRHQAVSKDAEERPGVLVLCVLSVQEVCGMQGALCERPAEKQPCIAFFSKDTAIHLAPTAGDTIHVYPPWQSLIVEGEQHPIILNTHLSQTFLAEMDQQSSVTCPRDPSPYKCRPYPLIRCLWQIEKNLESAQKCSPSKQLFVLNRTDGVGSFESLLEFVEASGPSGSICGPLKVVVQRVYFFPVQQSSSTSSHRHNSTVNKTVARPAHEENIGRVCMLVQDVYGMFSEVELKYISSENELKLYTEQLEGKVCLLQGLKVIQRLTRERCTQLFNLIDSLWPPSVPLRVHGEALYCQTDKVPAPSFCYRLAGQHCCPLPQFVSTLYCPPDFYTLREILQEKPIADCCSFKATVVYMRKWSVEEDLLLFVTDPSLQRPGSSSRTLPVNVSRSCLLLNSIIQAITSPYLRATLIFRDVAIKHGQVFCWGQSVIQLDPEQIINLCLPQPIVLDQLCLESVPCSLCTLTGVVVDVVEESAFSWPTCSQCGSDCLEAEKNKQGMFLCKTCGAMDKPTIKMQLEVFLSCPVLSHCTVKVKLQQKSIVSLLKSAGCTEGYEVENILGKKIGPLSAFIHVICRRPTLWMSLEEIIL